MSGQGLRYQKAGYNLPKPLIPVSERPMIERVLECFPQEWPVTFVMAENHATTDLPKVLKSLRPDSRVCMVPKHGEGPLRAIEEGLKHIPKDEPVLVSYCDYGMIWDSKQFERFVEQSECEACVISYKGFHAHYLSDVKYAYSRLDGERVVEVKEKGSFTANREDEYASSGGYYFRSARLLAKAAEYQRKHELKVNGEFYTSLTVQALLELNPKSHVRVFEIPGFFQWGTPEDLRRFEYWEKTFSAYNRTAALSPGKAEQVLMPMAGAGSRFTGVASVPKPFISVDGLSMYQRALRSLPQGPTTLVGLKSFKSELANDNHNHVLLDTTPDGQALSTRAGLENLDREKSVLISSCDHSIVLEADKWESFSSKPDCDAAIFAVTGFPGAKDKPQAFAYVVPVKDDNSNFPEVKSVSVKKPISENPDQDHLLVGTFWFRNVQILDDAIAELIATNVRVNNELYLDSIFDYMIKKGLRVRTIPLDGYINWGDPQSLSEALYWYEIFCARRIDLRSRFPGVRS